MPFPEWIAALRGLFQSPTEMGGSNVYAYPSDLKLLDVDELNAKRGLPLAQGECMNTISSHDFLSYCVKHWRTNSHVSVSAQSSRAALKKRSDPLGGLEMPDTPDRMIMERSISLVFRESEAAALAQNFQGRWVPQSELRDFMKLRPNMFWDEKGGQTAVTALASGLVLSLVVSDEDSTQDLTTRALAVKTSPRTKAGTISAPAWIRMVYPLTLEDELEGLPNHGFLHVPFHQRCRVEYRKASGDTPSAEIKITPADSFEQGMRQRAVAFYGWLQQQLQASTHTGFDSSQVTLNL